ncbi:hypothetical protein BDB00DRAFT_797826 [Zychaea mexicana]|uniref:uncharacterized protein n=1 Tax=Zychaea mexicana TaxID=64656 RepID=UPI0022FF0841|nr:uncharacterized protein BDB00DRAFT_797826 [Zychaea mexicana]KAI9499014.1 hypothetical protein BDB00DRAFT_797826 [Zychaea mexicana]
MSANARVQQGIAQEHPDWILPRLCQQNAYKTGIYSAIATGIVTFPIVQRFGLDKNRAALVAMAASTVGGYIVSQYAYEHCRKVYGSFNTAVEEALHEQQHDKK